MHTFRRHVLLQEGGLGDVVTALGRAVQEEGHEVEVVLPKYDCINYNAVQVGAGCRTCHCCECWQCRAGLLRL